MQVFEDKSFDYTHRLIDCKIAKYVLKIPVIGFSGVGGLDLPDGLGTYLFCCGACGVHVCSSFPDFHGEWSAV